MRNQYTVENGVAHIQTASGQTIKVDVEDLEKIAPYRWNAEKDPLGKYYARTRSADFRAILSNFLLDTPEGMVPEHINGDKLDCRRENMRVVTPAKRAHSRQRKAEYMAASGVENVTVAKHASGRTYYFASVTRDGVKKSKNFPYTPEGLEAARQLVAHWLDDITYEPDRVMTKRTTRDMTYATPEREAKIYLSRIAPQELPAGTWRTDGVDFYLTMRPGIEVIVSPKDRKRVEKHSWWLMPTTMNGYYAATKIDGRTTYMHRFIMKAPHDMQVDHLNHDTLDNRRENLVTKTIEHNNANRDGAYVNSKTGIRGLSIHRCKPSGLMYVYRCHCLSCKVAKYFEYSEAGFEEAKQFAEEHNEIRDRITNNPYF